MQNRYRIIKGEKYFNIIDDKTKTVVDRENTMDDAKYVQFFLDSDTDEFERFAIKRLKQLSEDNSDIEGNHREADNILVTMLKKLGKEDITNEYSKIQKWFS